MHTDLVTAAMAFWDFIQSDEGRLVLWGTFARGVALVYAISFASLSTQITAWPGKHGIAPVGARLQQFSRVYFPQLSGDGERTKRRTSACSRAALYVRRFCSRPTLLWLVGWADGTMWAITACGFTLSALLLVGGWSWSTTCILFAATWFLYLSLDVAFGLAYPWDSLLLSVGFLLIFSPPLQAAGFTVASLGVVQLPDPQLCFLVRWLLARLLLGFGKLKFMGTGAHHHCYIRGFLVSQPMPTKFGWLAHHLPLAVHKFALGGMFVVEILLPPLFFVGGTCRVVAAVSAALLMVGIQLTGNFGYFNLLTTAVAVAVMDPVSAYELPGYSSMVASVLDPATYAGGLGCVFNVSRHHVLAVLVPAMVFGSLIVFLFNSWVNLSWLHWPAIGRTRTGFWGHYLSTLRSLSPWRVLNAFGVFPPKSQPPLRWVVIMEGSQDGGASWKEYHWKYMTSGPGDSPAAAPRCVAPHHPRIDHRCDAVLCAARRKATFVVVSSHEVGCATHVRLVSAAYSTLRLEQRTRTCCRASRRATPLCSRHMLAPHTAWRTACCVDSR